jgi:hypothetical protein
MPHAQQLFFRLFIFISGCLNMSIASADTVITTQGKDSTWQNIVAKDKLAVTIDGKLEYLWDFNKGYLLWRGNKHYWRMNLETQERTLEEFWGNLEIEQVILLPNKPCTKTSSNAAMQQQCFGYALTNLPAKGESKIWNMLESARFGEDNFQCNWSSKQIGTLAKQVVANPLFDDWIKKPRKTLFLHPMTLFMSYTEGNPAKLDTLRTAGADALTLYASHHEKCEQESAPKVSIATVPSTKELYQLPKQSDIVEFNYQHALKEN